MRKHAIIELRFDQVDREFSEQATVCMIICSIYNASNLRFIIDKMLHAGCISFILCCDDNSIEDFVDYYIDDNEYVWKKFTDLFGFDIVITSIFSIDNISDSVDFFIYGFNFIDDVRMIIIYDDIDIINKVNLLLSGDFIMIND